MDFVSRALCLLVGYLCGCILTADIVSRRLAGKRVFQLGDGNPGMANVGHCLGTHAAAYTLAGDLGKVILASIVAGLMFPELESAAVAWAGLGATLGHNYPFWHNFKGGKGVATTCATIVLASPIWGGLSCIMGLAAVLGWGYLCVGAAVIPSAFAVFTLVFGTPDLVFVALALVALMIPQHWPAIAAIRTGETPKASIATKFRQKLPWAAHGVSEAGHTAAWMAQRGAQAAEKGAREAGKAVMRAGGAVGGAVGDAVTQAGGALGDAMSAAGRNSKSKQLGQQNHSEQEEPQANPKQRKTIERKRIAAVSRDSHVEWDKMASAGKPHAKHAAPRPAVPRRAYAEPQRVRTSRGQYVPRHAASGGRADDANRQSVHTANTRTTGARTNRTSTGTAAEVVKADEKFERFVRAGDKPYTGAVAGGNATERIRARVAWSGASQAKSELPARRVRKVRRGKTQANSHRPQPYSGYLGASFGFDIGDAPSTPWPVEASGSTSAPEAAGPVGPTPTTEDVAAAQEAKRPVLGPGSTQPMVIPKIEAPFNESDPLQRALTKVQDAHAEEATAQKAAKQADKASKDNQAQTSAKKNDVPSTVIEKPGNETNSAGASSQAEPASTQKSPEAPDVLGGGSER